ncbi:MAG: MerR family transcriptional regulator [Nocardioidaceae bacterium]|nr:MerR family transcriptional regulator [Nocardioidaceae bacterium]
MRMSELADRSGVPIPTIKFYLREQLLPRGQLSSRTQASYDDSHLRRLRLVRSLVEVAGLRLEVVRRVLAAVDDEAMTRHDVLGRAHSSLSLSPTAPASSEDLDQVETSLEQWGWKLHDQSPLPAALAQALLALDSLGHPMSDEALEAYAKAAVAVASVDVSQLPVDRSDAVETAVVGTLLREPVLLILRRMAQEVRSGQSQGQ